MHTLEAVDSLDLFVTASTSISKLYENDPTTRIHRDEGWIEVMKTGPEGGSFKLPMWRGICVWRWDGSEPRMIGDGFTDKIRADFSPDGGRLAIHQQGGDGAIYDVANLSQVVPALTLGADGLRFIDQEGKYLAVMTYHEKKLRILTLNGPAVEAIDLPLRNWSAGGRRPMVTFPEKQWIFIGLRDGRVDWYQFRGGPKPPLGHVATLK